MNAGVITWADGTATPVGDVPAGCRCLCAVFEPHECTGEVSTRVLIFAPLLGREHVLWLCWGCLVRWCIERQHRVLDYAVNLDPVLTAGGQR